MKNKKSDTNLVQLTGKVRSAEIAQAGKFSFLRIKIQVEEDATPAVTVSCFINQKNQKMAEDLKNLLTRENTYVTIADGTEAGRLKDKAYKFFDVSADVQDVVVLNSRMEPKNSASFTGSVVETTLDPASGINWIVLGTSYYSKDPNVQDAKGEWKQRFVNLAVPKPLHEALGQISVLDQLVVEGRVAEKFGSDWKHHILVKGIAKC